MRPPLRVEQLETRDLPSGGLGLIEPAMLGALDNWYRAESQSLLASASAILSSTPLATPTLAGIFAANGITSERWDQLLVGTWYVPSSNLLAYLIGPIGTTPMPIADQTLFRITGAYDGFFVGENSVQLSVPTPLGWVQADPMLFAMSGFVTPEGQIRITFTPTDPNQTNVTGVGNMELVDGSWRMTMQMATGAAPDVIHWAFMTELTPGATIPTAPGPSPDNLPTSEQWSWLLGTTWGLADTELFGSPGAGVFHIDGFDNGYFWGNGIGPTPFSVVGSVTPEGNLFLLLTPAGGGSVTRTGSLLERADGRWDMFFRSYEGSPALGAARLVG